MFLCRLLRVFLISDKKVVWVALVETPQAQLSDKNIISYYKGDNLAPLSNILSITEQNVYGKSLKG